jgi:hypothetical protein
MRRAGESQEDFMKRLERIADDMERHPDKYPYFRTTCGWREILTMWKPDHTAN